MSSRSSSGVKCGSDNGTEELRCSSICGGAATTQDTERLFNPFISLPERIQPDTRHPPGRGPFPQPSPPNLPLLATSSHPSSNAALREPLHSQQILIFLLMTRRFGYRVLTASLLRDYSGQRNKAHPSGADGFLPPLANKKCLFFCFFWRIHMSQTQRRLKASASLNHWLTGRSCVTPQLFASPHYNNCVCVFVCVRQRATCRASRRNKRSGFFAQLQIMWRR